MGIIRRRIGRLFENLIAFGVGAVVVCLARGMTVGEIWQMAQSNAHRLPDLIGPMVSQILAPGVVG